MNAAPAQPRPDRAPRLCAKRALVTGAGRGIGEAVARAFAREGANVAIADVNLAPAKAIARELSQCGTKAVAVPLDVSSRASVEAAIAVTLDALGGLDVLVNNAGICEEKAFLEIDDESWEHMITVNLRGVFFCCRAVLPHFLANKAGRIINVASQLALIGGERMAHYTASKAGVIGLTKALAREYAGSGILVNAIAPGPVDTQMTAANSPEWRHRRISALPLGRFADPSEIAPSAVFLASEDAGYFVGQVLGPNGGDAMP